jgi:glycosyltransferase involved in cell wall biosynthesis
MSPNVSILMPAYNAMPYLCDAVQSILDQTLRSWRCVIVNDGSTDNTREFLDSIRDDRFTILHQENSGISAALNRGLEYCDGRYLARLDADDVARPTRLAEQAAFLEARPDVGLVGTQVAPLGDAGSGRSLRLPTDHDDIIAALVDGRHAMVHSSMMGRTALLKELGGYWELPIGEEYDLMLRAGEVSRLANIDRVLVLWRVHEQSLTGSKMRDTRFYIDYACESARRRQEGRPRISLEEYRAWRDTRPWWRQWGEAINVHARCQYRIALSEIYGRRPLRGSVRLAAAAVCAPRLTVERFARMLRPRRPAGEFVPSEVAPQTHDVAYATAEEAMSTVGGSVG